MKFRRIQPLTVIICIAIFPETCSQNPFLVVSENTLENTSIRRNPLKPSPCSVRLFRNIKKKFFQTHNIMRETSTFILKYTIVRRDVRRFICLFVFFFENSRGDYTNFRYGHTFLHMLSNKKQNNFTCTYRYDALYKNVIRNYL